MNFKRNRTAKLVKKARKKLQNEPAYRGAKNTTVGDLKGQFSRSAGRKLNAKMKAKHNLKSTGW